MFDLKCDYTIKFKATKRIFNIFDIRRTYVVSVDAEPLEDGADMSDSIDEMQDVVNQYANFKNLKNAKLISYTRYNS